MRRIASRAPRLFDADSKGQSEQVGPDAQPPPTDSSDYAKLNLVYGGLVAAVAMASRRRPAADLGLGDQATLALAAFSLSKLIARERVGSWVREPFVEEGTEKSARAEPTGRGMRRVVGELVTCTRCVGAWSSAGLLGLRVLAPDTGRTVTLVLASAGANDFLQAVFRVICERAAREESSRP